MIRKVVVSVSFLLAISACDQAPEIGVLSPSSPAQNSGYAPEELLGKTVEEFTLLEGERLENEKQKSTDASSSSQPSQVLPEAVVKNGFLQLDWDTLIAPGYDANSILARYEPQIGDLEHGGEKAIELYQQMQDEFNNAPANEELSEKNVSIPGFIAPLEQSNGIITEFLLVPYFGACIHLPAPPANQTVYVKTARDYGIKLDDSYNPIWVSGKMLIENESTEIGAASYQIHEALISPYQQ